MGETMTRRSPRSLPLLLLAALLIVAPARSAEAPKPDRDAFAADLRQLWEDHIVWTRMYIVSAVAGLPDQSDTAARLLRNQADLGDAIRPFYGDEAGDQLTGLLRDHILIAAELIDAAKAGDEEAQADAAGRWFANADDIAAFLNAANPKNWPLEEMRQMMRDHLNLTVEEVVAYLQEDWVASIAAYDEVHLQILAMADMLSSGIAAQFPNRFNS
jgi:hypothetical protein